MTSTADVEANLRTAERLCREAVEDGARLVVLPESFAFLGPEEGKLDVAEPLPDGGPILQRCCALARQTGVELILGGFWERGTRADKVLNACVHLDAHGQIKSIYRKIHLFDIELADGTVIKESDTIEAGSEPVVTRAPFGLLGLSICYDMRFPELYRKLVDRGAIAMCVPAAFTRSTGMDHWHVLLRARAIESQAYLMAAAQYGNHFGQRWSYGHALVCDPWGCVLSECGGGQGFASAYIDPATVEKVRTELPSLKHRRLQ
jgi:predicted amidohydrolase